MTDEAPKTTTVRIAPELRPALDEFAYRTRRSLTGAVNYLIQRGLDVENAPAVSSNQTDR